MSRWIEKRVYVGEGRRGEVGLPRGITWERSSGIQGSEAIHMEKQPVFPGQFLNVRWLNDINIYFLLFLSEKMWQWWIAILKQCLQHFCFQYKQSFILGQVNTKKNSWWLRLRQQKKTKNKRATLISFNEQGGKQSNAESSAKKLTLCFHTMQQTSYTLYFNYSLLGCKTTYCIICHCKLFWRTSQIKIILQAAVTNVLLQQHKPF